MCGIAGILCAQPVSEEALRKTLQQMLRSILHRGPDESGMAFTPYGGLGHQRLSIIDVRSGQQPFYHPTKPYVLVFNGEIYNFVALREKLAAKGVSFETRSDTEVLMMMYDHYDEDMFQYLEGMYAFAIWNGLKNELILARDPLGKKPLYYEMDEHGITFASELKAILQARPSKPALNSVALEHYLALQFIPSPHTMFEGIYKLPPGYMLRWRIADESLDVLPTWIPDDEVSRYVTQNQHLRMDEALQLFDEKIQRATELRVKAADVPVGVFLSGGLDSSLITALAKQHTDYPLHTFSVGYANSANDERVFARHVAEALGTVHHELELGPEALDYLPRLLWHLDEPLADPALLATDQLARMASKDYGLKVVLTGQGADEIFGGYRKYHDFEALSRLRVPGPFASVLGGLVGGLTSGVLGWNRSQLLRGAIQLDDSLAIWQTYRNFPQWERSKLLQNKAITPDKRLRQHAKTVFSPYVQLQWDDLHRWLPHNLMLGLDKVTMAHGLEARAPFLDHHLLAWAFGLPWQLKWQGGQSKALLRAYAQQKLPPHITQRRKKGFDLPLAEWMNTRWDSIYTGLLESTLLQESGLFNARYVESLLNRYQNGGLKTAQPIWNLWVLKTWYDVSLNCNSKDDLWQFQTASHR